jgi:hypothetical protein
LLRTVSLPNGRWAFYDSLIRKGGTSWWRLSLRLKWRKRGRRSFSILLKRARNLGGSPMAAWAITYGKAAGEDTFMKRMEFQDLATMEKVMPANEKDPECRALIDKFESYTINISRKPYIKMT